MDSRFGRIFSSLDEDGNENGNGIHFGNNGSMPIFHDSKNVKNNGQIYESTFSTNYDPVNGTSSRYQTTSSSIYSQNFKGLQFPNLTNSNNMINDINNNVGGVSASIEDELNEDCDLSDAILGYISHVLMEEDMEDRSCMLQESLDLQAAEKPFYDVLGKKYPPSPPPWPPPSSDGGLTFGDHCENSIYVDSVSSYSDYLNEGSSLLNFGAQNISYTSFGSSSNGGPDSYSPASTADTFDLCNENQMMWQFRKGVEEANKFLPSVDISANVSYDKIREESPVVFTGSKVRKNPYGEDITEVEKEERSIKQAAIFPDPTLRSKEIDLIFLSSLGEGKVALDSFRDTLREEKIKDSLKDVEDVSLSKQKGKGRSKTRGRKQNRKKEVIDLRTLLITCAQAVAADDRRKANELLKQIRQHSSPFGDGSQRLAHCFANGLEARLAGTGSQIHKALVSKKTCAADYIKAYQLYMATSPFRKISNFASNRTIMDKAENAMRVHIIDFGILYGFQWPTFLQRISQRKGGPPRVRITGIEFPQPGFRPAQRIEETGWRLKAYADHFKVPFEYSSIAKRWENVTVEELMLDEGEFLVVNCMYRAKNLLDETVVVDSARNIVLNLIKKINPDIFIHGILNGSYNAPFFLTRFREALFHFSALFDMLETNVPRERPERMLLEKEIFGREALNVIACEGWERSERPETYKQWHVRNLRVGLVPVPLSRFIIKRGGEKVSLYHKDFLIDEDNHWLLQGWKGRIIYAISCWKPVSK
uniref:scarecrow-like protein 9 n=1 Tax=Erigeron canadensis TaxID=72917 RepID=UPI001CB9B0D1|nr:scarecrow-like protein 9 [Erigeron canadensis]